MRRPFGLPGAEIFFSLCMAALAICSPGPDRPATVNNTKRWFSKPPERGLSTWGTWPSIPCDANHKGITFCFETEDDANVLLRLFAGGIAKWAGAMDQSSLRIIPDPACGQNMNCQCDIAGIDPGTLRIAESGEEFDSEANVGYDYGNMDEEGRHELHVLPTGNDPDDVLTFAHELGHVLGLYHEHTRPDRDQYIDIDCKAILGYEDAQAKVQRTMTRGSRDFAQGVTLEDNMQRVCTDLGLAEKYFEAAIDWMREDQLGANNYEHSQQYDMNSIMQYGKDGSKRGMTAIKRKPPDQYLAIFMGGNQDPGLAGPSDLDIQRVIEMYPLPPSDPEEQPHQAERRQVSSAMSKQHRYQVVIPDVITTTVGPVPSQSNVDWTALSPPVTIS